MADLIFMQILFAHNTGAIICTCLFQLETN